MIEVSLLLFTLITEALVVCLVIISISVLLFLKRRKKDRVAARKLIDQVKHQSKTRLQTTSSFLNDKYRFEGDELQRAVKSIDQAEKKFIQKIINVYLNRDAHGLNSMDACVAEMIDTYKDLSPVMPEAEVAPSMDSEAAQELLELKDKNAKLTEELNITKETMTNMIGEFGNMFGGGKDHELDKSEVVEKVTGHETNEHPEGTELSQNDIEVDSAEQSVEMVAEDKNQIVVEGSDEGQSKPKTEDKVREDELIVEDDEVDELLNSIDLSDNSKLPQ